MRGVRNRDLGGSPLRGRRGAQAKSFQPKAQCLPVNGCYHFQCDCRHRGKGEPILKIRLNFLNSAASTSSRRCASNFGECRTAAPRRDISPAHNRCFFAVAGLRDENRVRIRSQKRLRFAPGERLQSDETVRNGLDKIQVTFNRSL